MGSKEYFAPGGYSLCICGSMLRVESKRLLVQQEASLVSPFLCLPHLLPKPSTWPQLVPQS